MSIKTYRLGIDARLAGQKHAGIGRYTKNLIQNLIKIITQEKYHSVYKLVIFFFDLQQAQEVLGEFYQNDSVEIVLTKVKHYGLQEQFLLPKFYKQAQLDLLYVPHWNIPILYRGKLIITIHDLLWHEQKGTGATTLPSWQYFIKYLAYRCISYQASRKARIIIVPTQTIKDTVLRYYPFTRHKLFVSKEGISPIYETALKQQLPVVHHLKKQLVYTGSLYPHKNLKLVIQSLSKLPRYKLYIVSARSIFQDQVRQLVARYKVKKQVVFLGFVPDEKLVALYQQSLALVQPSFSEGFGLTGIEAMASHLPVLASDIKVFREIYQQAAFFFDPHSPDDFLRALTDLESANRKAVIQNGLAVAKQYSFAKMADEIWQQFLKQL